jgi:cell division initiation protein
MRITPLDVRKQEFRKAVRGLDADEVHAFLATVADEYEVVLTDNKKLRDKVVELDEKVGEYRNMEKTLRDTLLTAERVMAEARQNARKEADLVLRDAQMKASQEVAGISGRVEALHQQIRELRGHRDSYLLRLQSLSEAQLGLIDGYRKDFEVADTRVERAAGAIADASVPPPTRPANPAPSGPVIPVWEAPVALDPPTLDLPQNQDEWRRYDLGEQNTPAKSGPIPTPESLGSPPAAAPTHLHTSASDHETVAAYDAAPGYDAPTLSQPEYLAAPDYPTEEPADYIQKLSAEEYDARVASVADAWSGAVPSVDSDGLPRGQAAAIDEVSAALGMFTEGSDTLAEPASMEGDSMRVSPLVPESPYRGAPADYANDLAPTAYPTESVGHADGVEYPEADSIEASAEPQPEEQTGSQDGRWSLSRIARGIAGH